MQGFLAGGVYFDEKTQLRVDPYIPFLFSRFYVD